MNSPTGAPVAKEPDSATILNRLDYAIEAAAEIRERIFRIECCEEPQTAPASLAATPSQDFSKAAKDKLDSLTSIIDSTRVALRRFI